MRSLDECLRGRWGNRILIAALMALLLISGLLACRQLPYEFRRLLTPGVPGSAVDLHLRWDETRLWFSGQPVYTVRPGAVYPPQTYLVLWPFIGECSLRAARWGWAITSVLAILFLAGLIVQQTTAAAKGRAVSSPPEQTALCQWGRPALIFATSAVYVAAMYPTGVDIGNGQFILHLLCFLLPALLMLWRPSAGWGWDLLIALLLQPPLAKLTVALPFMWIVLLVPLARRPALLAGLRPAALTAGLYVLLTLAGAAVRPESLLELMHQWIHNTANATHGDYGNIHAFLAALNREKWSTPMGLAMGAVFGVWVWFARHADRWVLIGAASLVARLWTYHRVYDDLLVLPAMIALAIVALNGSRLGGFAIILLAVESLAMLIPARRVNVAELGGTFLQPLEITLWLVTLACLLWIPLSRPINRTLPATEH